VAGIARVPAGTYGLTLAVTDGDGGTTSRNATLRVLAEDANVAFDGANPVAVKAEPGATSGSFTLKVRVSEADTTSRGSISLARVTMSLVPLGSGTSIVRVGAGTVQNGVLVVPFNFSKVPVGTYDVQVTVNGGYYAGSGEDVLVVYDPSLGYTSGGGWFYWPNTARSGYAGDRTTFGFTTRYDQNGANLQGNLLLIRHLANGTFYRVRSNALSGLVLGENTSVPMGYASFSGGGSFRSPGSPGPVGCVLKVYVEDRNAPGTGTDRFWIQVTDGIAMSSPATQYAVNLGGGNIVVPHKAR
jgi:hypothetical protein